MKKKVLSDHKKRGQRFIPPVLDALPLQETSYVNQLLPEVIWLALLKVQIGNSRAMDIALQFMSLVNNCLGEGDFRNFALIGKFGEINLETKSSISDRLAETSFGDELLTLINPLLYHYPKCPLSFITGGGTITDKQTSVALLKKSVELHINRYSYDASVLQAMVAFLRQEAGGLHYAEHLEKPDFGSFIRNNDKKDWEKIAGRARLAANMELMPGGNAISNSWARYFWNRGVVITECELADG